MDYNKDYLEIVKSRVKEKRYIHTLGVIKEANILASKYDVDLLKAKIAATLHDISKYVDIDIMKKRIKEEFGDEFSNYPDPVLHSFMSSIEAKELGVDDTDILNAIKYHTTARKNMSTLEKIIYISDFCEEGREFMEAEVAREIALKSLDEAMVYIIGETNKYLLEKGNKILKITSEAYDYYKGLTFNMDYELIKIKEALDDAKLMEIHLYDLMETNPFFNYVFVSTAQNKRHLDSSIGHLDEAKIDYSHIEGKNSEWILIDKGDIIINILTKDARETYALDNLYMSYKMIY